MKHNCFNFVLVFLFTVLLFSCNINNENFIVNAGLYDLYIYDCETQTNSMVTQSPNVLEGYYGFTPDSRKIIFNAQDSTYLIDISGENLTALSTAMQSTQYLSSGETVVYYKDGDIFVLEIDTENHTQLTNSDISYWHPILSPDGQKIVCSSDNGLCFITMDGVITGFLDENSTGWYDWSYDSKEIAYTKTVGYYSQVFKYNIETEVETQLTSSNGYNYEPYWHPTMNKIVFTSGDADYGRDLIIMDSDATSQDTIFHQNWLGSPRWSPDGNQLVFINNNSNVAIIDADGENYNVINDVKGACLDPVWSPDGRYILYYRGIFYN